MLELRHVNMRLIKKTLIKIRQVLSLQLFFKLGLDWQIKKSLGINKQRILNCVLVIVFISVFFKFLKYRRRNLAKIKSPKHHFYIYLKFIPIFISVPKRPKTLNTMRICLFLIDRKLGFKGSLPEKKNRQ